LKIVNVSKSTTFVGNKNEILEPINCRNIEKLHLMGLAAPFASKRRRDAFYADKSDWFQRAFENNPRLYSFGPGECYGLTRFLTDVDSKLIQLADLNRFGPVLIGYPEYHSIWPLVLEQTNARLDDAQRQASVIYGLLSNSCFSSLQ
jgi:hypothetical protein